jgi:CubicO group peptidase (beta-lactamase class C family)
MHTFLRSNYFKAILFFCFQISFFNAVNSQPTFIKDSLDAYIQKGLKDWQIPGLAIVIIKDDKVVAMKGFGVRDIKGSDAVDENTLFMIASNTKLFTGTALAQLEYNKKLSLDDKITKYFSNYALYDKTSTELVTIKDMLSHRIGTKTFQGDFTFFDGNLSRAEIMFKMRYLKPVGQFRQDYGYCNSCFLTAGEIIPLVSGKPWEVYIYDSLIAPLGMTQTLTLSKGISHVANAAKPYTTSFTGTLNEVPYDVWDNLAPAASIVSNVSDLSHWLSMQLHSGQYNGKQIIARQAILKTRDVNIITNSRKSSFFPTHFRGYGLGVYATDYSGRQVYWHTGGASGMVSNVCFVPEEGLGIAILTNNDNQSFFEALRYQILDAYLGVPYTNRSQQLLNNFTPADKKSVADVAALKARIKNVPPPLPLANYAGEYNNELYGKMIVEQKDDYLTIKFKGHDNLTATVKYLDYNEWILEYNNMVYGIHQIKFITEARNVYSVDIKMNDFVEYDAYTFLKK